MGTGGCQLQLVWG